MLRKEARKLLTWRKTEERRFVPLMEAARPLTKRKRKSEREREREKERDRERERERERGREREREKEAL
jgi:hypothetical protein